MFKRFSNKNQESALQDLSQRPHNPFTTDLMNALEPHAFDVAEEDAREEEPETIIAAGVSIKGTISFQKLIRIDGEFEGELLSSGKLIIGPTGSVKANLNLEEAFISGKLTGDINVKKRLVLRGRAEVRGDITSPLLSVDEGVSIVGILNVVQEAAKESSEEEDPYSHPEN